MEGIKNVNALFEVEPNRTCLLCSARHVIDLYKFLFSSEYMAPLSFDPPIMTLTVRTIWGSVCSGYGCPLMGVLMHAKSLLR